MKKKLAKTLHDLSFLSGLSTLLAKRQPAVRIIMFHGVGGRDYPAHVFESQLRILARSFNVVPLAEIVEGVGNQESSQNQLIALTFDDGLRNNYTVAYPILQRLALPATFFVCPGLVGTGKWLRNYESRQRLLFLGDRRRELFCRDLGAATADIDGFLLWMKNICHDDRKEMQTELERLTQGYQPSPEEHLMFDMMSWEELADLPEKLITIGSHTVNHFELTVLDNQEMRYEIRESKRLLEDRLKRSIDFFCYPSGMYNDAALAEVRNTYRAAVSTDYGFVSYRDDVHALKRIQTAEELTYFIWRLLRPTS